MRLAARRFPDRIVRTRRGADTVNRFGETIPGPVTLTELRASLQPISNADLDLVEGSRLVERWTAFVPEPDALLAARHDAVADEVTIGGRGDFIVERAEVWGNHTKANLLREV